MSFLLEKWGSSVSRARRTGAPDRLPLPPWGAIRKTGNSPFSRVKVEDGWAEIGATNQMNKRSKLGITLFDR
jgi:hypothetical protein